MDVDEAIRSRRTLKAYTDEPVGRELVSELLDLAVLAPNHHETEPWRFWVVGRETLSALTEATGDRKLLRSHTAIVVGVKRDPDAQVAEEDYAATACAIENLMLAARGSRPRELLAHAGRALAAGGREDPGRPAQGAPDRRRARRLARRALPGAAGAQRRPSSRAGSD